MERIAAGCLFFLVCMATNSWGDLINSGTVVSGGGGGLYASEDWYAPLTRLEWRVENSGGDYIYTYTFTVSDETKKINHVIIQVPDFFGEDNVKHKTKAGWNLVSFTSRGKSKSGAPGVIKGIERNVSGDLFSYTWQVVSDLAPINGNFYARAGDKVYAYSGDRDGFTNTVPVPGGVGSEVPIPSAFLLLASGLFGVMGVKGNSRPH